MSDLGKNMPVGKADPGRCVLLSAVIMMRLWETWWRGG